MPAPFTPLTPEQQRLVSENLDMPEITAAKYVRRLPKFRSYLDDLIQEGQLGLMRAATSYRPGGGASFRTYALQWVRAFVSNAGRRTNGVMSGRQSVAWGQQAVDLEDDLFEALVVTEPDQSGLDARDTTAALEAIRASLTAEAPETRYGLPHGQTERDIDIFLRSEFEANGNQVAKALGMSRERVRQICVRWRPRFQAAAAKFREAEGYGA